MQAIRIISVDFQKDFSAVGGLCYRVRPCVNFIKEKVIPHLRKCDLKVAEIVSDYRLPRLSYEYEYCVPGTVGYESEIPDDVKHPEIWVKCMHSPIWVRENGGVANKPAGLPYPNPATFTEWLCRTIGRAMEGRDVVLIGLTLDCCVLCTAQELRFRGYKVSFLVEAVDTYNGRLEEKQAILKVPLVNWGKPISWEQFRDMLAG